VLLLLLLGGLGAPRLAPHDPYLVDLNRRLEGPSATFPLGTDQFGRCTLSRLLYGARATLGTALLVLVATVGLSGTVGGAASVGPRWARRAGAWVLDVGQSLPTMVVAVAVVGLLGPGLANAMVAVVVTVWAPPARLLRALFLGESRAAHVDAARALGASPARVFARHLLPGVVGRGAVVFATYLGQIILTFSALSFLGLGPQPPAAEWGAMLNEGRPFFWTHPSLMVLPGVAIVVAVGACNLLADALRDAADDRRRR
jgi:ABC-type dipeptide/oligopeptide/nickel transport system permease subunit